MRIPSSLLPLLPLLPLLLLLPLVSAHARIKYPPPIGAPAEAPEANAYNAPLAADGSQFPCKGLHKSALLSTSATTKWTAGESAYFEILGHLIPGAEGALAAHSGGSCQASLSFDGGVTWKVLHSYIGGCPRGVPLGSNLSTDPDQRFNFVIPANTRAGPALFAWTWIAVTGNRDEFYMNCAKVEIQGGGGDGGDMLEESPDMFLGDMNVQGHIGQGQCKSTPGAALRYPNPGEEVTERLVEGIPFKLPTDGKCFAPGSKGTGMGEGTPVKDKDGMAGPRPTASSAESAATSEGAAAGTSTADIEASALPTPKPKPSGEVKLPSVKIEVDEKAGTCNCTCQIE